MRIDAMQKLEKAMGTTDDVFVSKRQDAREYLASLEKGLRASICEPFELHAKVTETGFDELGIGEPISGICVAEARGYWLVYQPEWDTFVIFWGTKRSNLGAPGIEGSPLGCWSA